MTPTKHERAGIIPFYIENNKVFVYLMIPSNKRFGGTQPQIAKGCKDGDETPWETATREAYEEIGLMESNLKGDSITLVDSKNKITIFANEIYSLADFDEFGPETAGTVILQLTENNISLVRKWQQPYFMALIEYFEKKS